METNKEFKENVKNNEKRKKFFIDKYRTDLKHLDIVCDDATIEKLLLEAIESFNDIPITFSSYGLNYLKDKLKTSESKYTPNSIFSENEMVILENYLEKDINGNYLTTEEIAKKLSINVFDVTQAVYKLQNKLNYHKIKNIFGDFETKIIERKRNIRKQEKQNNTKKIKDISDNDIEIIGLFTGQINDICLDIEEIANLKNTTPKKMQEQIINIYELLEDKKNYDKLLLKYPTITQMLRIKGTGLGLSFTNKFKTNSSSNKKTLHTNNISNNVKILKYFYQQQPNGTYLSPQEIANLLNYNNVNGIYSIKNKILKMIDTDNKYKAQILKEYPELDSDMEIRNNTHIVRQRKISNEKIKKGAQILKYFYQPKPDGTYLSPQEIADLLNCNNIKSIYSIKSEILKKIDTNNEYKVQILKEYPELDSDMEIRNNTHIVRQRKISNEKIKKDAQILKYFYQPKFDGTYLSSNEIAKLLNYTKTNGIYSVKNSILKKIDTDDEYKAQILKEYPELDNDMEIRNNTHIVKQKKISNEKIKKDTQILKYFYQPKPDGTYLSLQEIAKLLNYTKTNGIYSVKNRILKKLNTNDEYKAQILQEYPELNNDMEIRNNTHIVKSKKSSNEKIKKDAQLLKYFYQPKPDGTYFSTHEIADLLNYNNINSIYSMKNRILKRINANNKYKNQILQEYPELDNDIEIRNNTHIVKQKKISNEKIKKDAQLLKYFYQQQPDGTYFSTQKIADLINISTHNIYTIKKKILQKINNDNEYKVQILQEYPELDNDMEIRNNTHIVKSKKISNKKIKKDAQLLKYLYQPNPDGSYLSTHEIADLLNYSNNINNIYTVKNRILKKLNTNNEYKTQILKEYPELNNDMEIKNNTPQNKISNEKIKKDVQLLKYLYQPKPDGSYLSIQEIANLLNLTVNHISKTKTKLSKDLINNQEYKVQILKEYPELDNDMEIRNNTHIVRPKKISNKRIKKNVQILKYLYKPRPDGSYLSLQEIADLLNYKNISTIYIMKNKILKKLNTNDEYKNQVLKEYPELDSDMEIKNNIHIVQQRKIIKDVQLLKYFYQQKSDGTYFSTQEIANLLNYNNINSIYSMKNKILKKLNTNDEYKNQILREYPELDNDMKIRNNTHIVKSKKISNEKIKKDAQLLKYFYQQQPDGTYFSTHEIADLINISTHNIYTIKNKILQKINTDNEYKAQILQEYPELDNDIEIRNNTHIVKPKKISNEKIKKDVQLLKYLYQPKPDGSYLSLQEIANLLNLTLNHISKTKTKLSKDLINNQEYKAQILKEYPELDNDMEIRNNTHIVKQKKISNKGIKKDVQILKYLYQSKPDGSYLSLQEITDLLNYKNINTIYIIKNKLLKKLNTDDEYKNQILKEYPELDNDMEIRNNIHIVQQRKIIKDVQLLKYLYQPKPDGSYLSLQEIADLLNYNNIRSMYTIKSEILKMLDADIQYKAQILKEYPELDNDMEIRNNTQIARQNKISNEKIKKDAKTLKYFYQPKSDGTYYSIKEIAEILNIKSTSLYSVKSHIFIKLNQDQNYKNKILEEYPNLYDDIEIQKNIPTIIPQEKINRDVEILKYIYKPKSDGTYFSMEDISKLIDINISYLYTSRNRILEKLNNSSNYKEQILDAYPELVDDIEKKNNNPITKQKKISNEKINKDVQLLKYFYQPNPDGTYLSTQEIGKLLNITSKTASQNKYYILQKLNDRQKYKKLILAEYPELYNDIEKKNNKVVFTEKEKEFADLLYTDNTKIIEPKENYCKKLNINSATFEILRNGVMTKLVKNKNLRKTYPNYEVENEIIEDYNNNKSIILSEQELLNIKHNSRKYDIPNNNKYIDNDSNNNLMKGIRLLEESNYGDYISLCTYEQKAMIALKFAFFNNTSYSTKYICNKFNVNSDELSILMKECLEIKNKQKIKVK